MADGRIEIEFGRLGAGLKSRGRRPANTVRHFDFDGYFFLKSSRYNQLRADCVTRNLPRPSSSSQPLFPVPVRPCSAFPRYERNAQRSTF